MSVYINMKVRFKYMNFYMLKSPSLSQLLSFLLTFTKLISLILDGTVPFPPSTSPSYH